MKNCLFCKIISGEIHSHKIWEDEKHLAFLSIFPNTEGVTVVVTKKHNPSYIFETDETTMQNITKASKKVALGIDNAFDDVGRTGLVFEGFGVDHLHAKLFPMHGTSDDKWKQKISSVNKYFKNYEGYLSSHDYKEANKDGLEKTAEKIRNALKIT